MKTHGECRSGHAWVLGTCGRCGLPEPVKAIAFNDRIASAAALLGVRVGTLVDCLVSNGLTIVTPRIADIVRIATGETEES